jgi:hypothetical protein
MLSSALQGSKIVGKVALRRTAKNGFHNTKMLRNDHIILFVLAGQKLTAFNCKGSWEGQVLLVGCSTND